MTLRFNKREILHHDPHYDPRAVFPAFSHSVFNSNEPFDIEIFLLRRWARAPRS